MPDGISVGHTVKKCIGRSNPILTTGWLVHHVEHKLSRETIPCLNLPPRQRSFPAAPRLRYAAYTVNRPGTQMLISEWLEIGNAEAETSIQRFLEERVRLC